MKAQAKTITAFRVSWTADHEQYWQGHGVAFTEYDECVTGCGETLREAFEDAVEQLAMDGFDVGAYHVIHEKEGVDKMLSVEQEMLAELDGADLDVGIVEAYCDAEGAHKTECQDCAGDAKEKYASAHEWLADHFQSELADTLATKLSGDDIQDLFQDEMSADGYFGCETCERTGVVEDEDPDCAVCAGEWHFYVSIDVSVSEAGDAALESSGKEGV